MAKLKTKPYGLRPGHPMPFRRTIKGKKPYQLVFEPGKPQDLSDQEVAALKKEIEGGLIVPWDVSANDHRERIRPLRQPGPEPNAAGVASDGKEAELADDEALLGDE